MMKRTKSSINMNWKEFEDKYKPIQNNLIEDAPYDNLMFDYYAEELDFVRQQNINNIWTIIHEDGITKLVPGFHYINRLGYVLTEVSYDDYFIEVIIEGE